MSWKTLAVHAGPPKCTFHVTNGPQVTILWCHLIAVEYAAHETADVIDAVFFGGYKVTIVGRELAELAEALSSERVSEVVSGESGAGEVESVTVAKE